MQLIGGINKSEGTASGGEGDDNKAGDKGQPDGDPYATSYFTVVLDLVVVLEVMDSMDDPLVNKGKDTNRNVTRREGS